MSKKLPFLRRVFRLIYQYLYLILILNLALGLFRRPIVEVKWCALFFMILVLSYVFREICSRGFYLLLVHIVFGAVALLVISDPYLKWVSLAVVLEFYIDGLYYIHSGFTLKRFFEAPWPSVLIGVATLALGYHFNNDGLVMLGYMVPLAITIVFLIALYLEGLEEYLTRTKHVSGAPFKQIISVNSLIICAIFCVVFAVIAIGDLLSFDVALANFGKSIYKLLKLIVMIILFLFKLLYSLFFGGMPKLKKGGRKIEQLVDEPGLLANIIEFIFISAFIVFVAYVIIRFFRWIIRLIISKQDRKNDLVENLSAKKPNTVEKERYVGINDLEGDSPVIKARKIYKKKVTSFKDKFTADKKHTTKDIEDMMNSAAADMSGDSNYSELTDMYNQVRYGNVIPDRKFLKDMKSLSKE